MLGHPPVVPLGGGRTSFLWRGPVGELGPWEHGLGGSTVAPAPPLCFTAAVVQQFCRVTATVTYCAATGSCTSQKTTYRASETVSRSQPLLLTSHKVSSYGNWVRLRGPSTLRCSGGTAFPQHPSQRRDVPFLPGLLWYCGPHSSGRWVAPGGCGAWGRVPGSQ